MDAARRWGGQLALRQCTHDVSATENEARGM